MTLTFKERVEANKDKPRIDNASLYAGSPMHYYCLLCGTEMILPETHMEAAPRFCEHCIRDGFAKNSYERTSRPLPE